MGVVRFRYRTALPGTIENILDPQVAFKPSHLTVSHLRKHVLPTGWWFRCPAQKRMLLLVNWNMHRISHAQALGEVELLSYL